MKKSLLYSVFFLASILHLSAQDLGKIVISNARGFYPKFSASLNGIRSDRYNSNSASFDNLEDCDYRVKIRQEGCGQVLSFDVKSQPGYVSNYVISQDHRGRYILVLEEQRLCAQAQFYSNPVVVNPSRPAYNTAPPKQACAISDDDCTGIIQALRNESFESTRLKMAETSFHNQHLSAQQVYEILNVFSFENSKVSFAKYAYARTVDKQNYYKVYDAFSFSSSKDEVSRYIMNKS